MPATPVPSTRKENGTLSPDFDLLILRADARRLPLPDRSIDCIVTSPPYWGLRDYGTPGQIGLERTWKEYVRTLRNCAREWWRVLKPQGSLWLNLGDSFVSNSDGCARGERCPLARQPRVRHGYPRLQGFPPKMKLGLPWRVRFALNEDGWISRSDVVWAKVNAMPVSVTDRFSCRHEYLFHLVKQRRYYFDLESVREPFAPGSLKRFRTALRGAASSGGTHQRPESPGDPHHAGARYKHEWARLTSRATANRVWSDSATLSRMLFRGRNPGDVWVLSTAGFRGAHVAVFPEKLAEIPIKATCPPGGVVLDPFAGSGTVGLVAIALGRRAVLSDLSYQGLQVRRIRERFPKAKIERHPAGLQGWEEGEGAATPGGERMPRGEAKWLETVCAAAGPFSEKGQKPVRPWRIIHSECLKVLARIPADSVGAVVTDPPYHLTVLSRNGSPRVPGSGPFGRHRIGERGFMGQTWDGGGISFEPKTWAAVRRVAKPGAHLLAFGGARTFHRLACAIEDAGWEIRDCLCWLYGQGFPKSLNLDDGRGTALKPAWEPIIVARKPMQGTLVENLQRWRTGALNVDACRLPLASRTFPRRRNARILRTGSGGQDVTSSRLGRWPANVCLDEGAAAMLDQMVGPQQSGGTPVRRFSDKTRNAYSRFRGEENPDGIGPSTGRVSRFFYCAKASRSEREAGCDGLPARTGAHAVDREERSEGLKSPRAGAGRTAEMLRNFHPTVKPIALMRWLVRLVTPAGGIVLDPFAGSGSTGCACALEGPRFIGIEKEKGYAWIARARIRYWSGVALSRRTRSESSTPRSGPALRVGRRKGYTGERPRSLESRD